MLTIRVPGRVQHAVESPVYHSNCFVYPLGAGRWDGGVERLDQSYLLAAMVVTIQDGLVKLGLCSILTCMLFSDYFRHALGWEGV